ncbi:hypothetical protein GRS48_10390 [Halorubrum sp. JWXQ-INN 858]|uniref:hypothetical protein n=1 Tax=Halorubrum sp. JWXQ-INN 858 TaxID=2690782 RepID=UPI00135CA201|nr:hypothetical protein [Halorubrum sp. JWXQ-INN 858]MWV65225.1 hypothetical protein [Halorubrum sp. JWXQ-INN 858]
MPDRLERDVLDDVHRHRETRDVGTRTAFDVSADPPDGEARATVALDVETPLSEREAELREQLEAGEIDEEEAQELYQEAQQTIIDGLIEVIETHATTRDGLDVVETRYRTASALVDGEALKIVRLVDHENVSAVLAAADFEPPDANDDDDARGG